MEMGIANVLSTTIALIPAAGAAGVEPSNGILLSYHFAQGEKQAYRHTMSIAGEGVSFELSIEYVLEILQVSPDGSAEICVAYHPEHLRLNANGNSGEVTSKECSQGLETYRQFFGAINNKQIWATVSPSGAISNLRGRDEIRQAAVAEIGERNAVKMESYLIFWGVSESAFLPILPLDFPSSPVDLGDMWKSQRSFLGIVPIYWRLAECLSGKARLEMWMDLSQELDDMHVILGDNGEIVARDEEMTAIVSGWAIASLDGPWDTESCVFVELHSKRFIGIADSRRDYRTAAINVQMSLEPIMETKK